MNDARIAETLFFAGLVAQCWGVWATFGWGWVAVVAGSEMALVGLLGVLRR